MGFQNLLAADEADMQEHYPNRREHAADIIVHAIAILAALIGGGVVFVWSLMHGGTAKTVALALYAIALLVMLGFSAAYNLTRPNPHRRVLRRLDEAGIFLMIAGSYTPFTMSALTGWLSPAMTALVWVIALGGVAGKLFAPRLSERFWCGVFIAFGWLAVAIFWPLAQALPAGALALLVAGGVIYTSGVAFYLWERLPFRRAIWHGFVTVGASTHFAAICAGVVFR